MLKNTLKTITTLVLISTMAHGGKAAPQLPPSSAAFAAKTARPAYSPLPSRLRPSLDILRIRDTRQQTGGSGGCWSQCFTMYDECLARSDKNTCVSRIKTCMETCDRLSGMTNPTQR